jgi:hypothetical protein
MACTVKDFNDNPVEVKVGDYVGFKSDIEQCGKITKITRTHHSYELTLSNPNGFDGEYIGGQTITTETADRCWKD